MDDRSCVRFLQQSLPQMRKRWPGFRRVRGQVCKRIQRRLDQIGLADIDAYRDYLHQHPEEWAALDHCCRVTVSRFYRDRSVLEQLGKQVLPALAGSVLAAGENRLRAWSAGCAMGEEAYSLVLMWDNAVQADPKVDIHVTGSDIDEALLQRARKACYGRGSLKAVPDTLLRSAFRQRNGRYCLVERLRNKAVFIRQDIRDASMQATFHLVFCRNLAFTYFDKALQRQLLSCLADRLVEGGALVIGSHESLPEGQAGFESWNGCESIFRKAATVGGG